MVCVRVWCDGLVWAPVRWVQEDGTTALWIASQQGHVGVVRALLASGADVTAAHVSQWQAVDRGHGMCDGGGRAGQDRQRRGGQWSIGRGMCVCAVGEAACGGLVCACLCLGVACMRDHACVYVSVCSETGGGCVWALRVCAVNRVCCECVQRDGRTALYVASQEGKEEVVEVLVSSGAAVNATEV